MQGVGYSERDLYESGDAARIERLYGTDLVCRWSPYFKRILIQGKHSVGTGE
jgi:hypothetical protein